MKKIIYILLLLGFDCFAEDYEQLYFKVVSEYGEDRISDFQNIWSYAEENNYELSWQILKELLDNPQCL